MKQSSDPKGEGLAFDRSWRKHPEGGTIHWCPEPPQNQIQLAFRNHWRLFQEIMGRDLAGRSVLEVGCGRGSMSAHFAEAGFDCTLLDISPAIVERARTIFSSHRLPGKFLVGDAERLPFRDKCFNVVVSIGLLEHFRDPAPTLHEQVRVLDRGGILLGYVVPELPNNVQREYDWINNILQSFASAGDDRGGYEKEELFRSAALSAHYLEILGRLPLKGVQASGVYPLPMISPSIRFPFTLMPPACEAIIVQHFSRMLQERGRLTGSNPWLCDEDYGQAFLVWGFRI